MLEMTSKLIHSQTILSFIIFILNCFCFDEASSKIDFVKNETKSEQLVKRSMTGTYSLNASVETLEVNAQISSQHTGYISIKRSYDARLFYYFFESRGNKNDPIVLWLTGDSYAHTVRSLFYPNGPFHINDDLSLRWNEFGLDKVCNLLYVDQPTGTGFSYSSDHRDIRNNSKEVSEDLYDFLETFFQTRPNLLENHFYIAGSGYNVHMAPLLASLIHQKNKAKEGVHINLKGLAITNGNTNPEYTQSAFPDFIYDNGLISRISYDALKKFNKECLTLIQHCQTDDNICRAACDRRLDIFNHMRKIMGNPHHFDFRVYNGGQMTKEFNKMKNFFSLDHVKRALGIENRTYVAFSREVFEAMYNDSMKNYAGVIPQLLEDEIKVLIFDGDCDLVCNWLGNFRWLEAMRWSGRNQYLKTKLTPYKIDGKEVGNFKNMGPLTFLKVFDAGHEVARDQPYISLQIFKKWMSS